MLEKKDLEQIKKIVEVVESRLNKKIESTKTSLNGKIATSEDYLSKKIESTEVGLNGKIEAVESRLSKKIESTEVGLNEKIEAVESRLSKKIESTEVGLNGKIAASEDRIVSILSREVTDLAEINHAVIERVDVISKLEKRITRIERKVGIAS